VPILAALALALLAVVLVVSGSPDEPDAIARALADAGPVPAARFPDQHGDVVVGAHRRTRADIRRRIERHVTGPRTRWFTWDIAGQEIATATAYGTGDGHWFVNSFLVGFRPLHIDHPPLALALLARRKTYTRDVLQYRGAEDVWQTSREAWINTRGDCEDHALVLADWLIELGLDARVAVGDHGGEGHAWVVVLDGGRQYLLEATDKQTRRRPLPRVETTRGYRPQIQFDRESFWVNTGHAATRDYAGAHWERRSRFVRTHRGASF
jgi:hypothetical protein